MLLSNEEMRALWLCSLKETQGPLPIEEFVRAIEVAILAKLAAKELPEPAFALSWKADQGRYTVNKPNIDSQDCYTADQLRQAHAQGFAAGAAAQLSAEPVGFIDKCGEIFAQVEQILSTDTPLYTRREAK